MKTFRSILNETLTSPYEFSSMEDKLYPTYTFVSSNGIGYKVRFNVISTSDFGEEEYEETKKTFEQLSGKVLKPEEIIEFVDIIFHISILLSKKHLEDKLKSKSLFGIAGTGDEFKIIATVMNIIRHFNETMSGKNVLYFFSSKEKNRSKLYKKILERNGIKFRMTDGPDIVETEKHFLFVI